MDEQINEASQIRQEIDRLRASEALKNPLHPSHPKALDTLSKLYSQEYREPDDPPPAAEEIEATKAEVNEVEVEALKVDDPAQAAIEESLKPLKESWGAAYEENVKSAQDLTANLVKEYGIDSAEVFDQIGNSPLVIRNLYAWSRGEPGDNLTADEAKEVIQLLQRTDAYKSGASRTSETVQQIVQALYEIAYRS
jgi:hypothetical protein